MIAAVQDLGADVAEGRIMLLRGGVLRFSWTAKRSPATPLCGVINAKGSLQKLRGSATARRTAVRLL